MSESRDVAWQQTKADKYRRIYRNFRYDLEMKMHSVWWRFLWATKLGHPYSKFMCRMKWYRKYPDGRCMYCGVVK